VNFFPVASLYHVINFECSLVLIVPFLSEILFLEFIGTAAFVVVVTQCF
jgi:hypothetical protein